MRRFCAGHAARRPFGPRHVAGEADWATLVQRRAKKDPVDQGGWSIYHTSWSGTDQMNPVGHVLLRGNGKDATSAGRAARGSKPCAANGCRRPISPGTPIRPT
jgi:hypothetical protein